MNNSIKTISYEEVQEFLKEIKSGDLYKVVSRKHILNSKENINNPYILNLFQNKCFKVKENSVVLVIDKIPTATTAPLLTPNRMPLVQTRREITIWHSSFLKVLYEDQICLIHAGWLERIR